MVQPKYSPEEALERVKLMMKYDTSKTLSEQITDKGKAEQDLAKGIPAPASGLPFLNFLPKGQPSKPETQTGLPAWANNYPCLLKNNLGTPIRTDRGEVQINVSSKDYIVFYKGEKCVYVFGNGTMVNGSWSCKDGKLYIYYENGKVYDDSKEPSKSKLKSTQKPESNSTQNPSSNSAQLPPDLKDVKDFQDWLDINAKGWATGYKDGKLSQGAKNTGFKSGGYGKFGPRTQKAWETYKDRYLKKTGTDITSNKPDEIEQVDADDSTDILN